MWSTPASARLGIRYPVVQGPFGGGYSTVALTAAVSNAGGLGSFGAHHLEPGAIGEVVAAIRAATGAPFAINLWVPTAGQDAPLPAGAFESAVQRLRGAYAAFGLTPPTAPPATYAPSFEGQLEAVLSAAPPVVSFVMGVPPRDFVDRAHAKGLIVLGTASTVEEAIALEAGGVDVIVASGTDAGGHRGAFLRSAEDSLVGTFSLVPQVVDAANVPVIAAGGVGDGRGIVAALALGADGVQIGTAFLASDESAAPEVHKALLGTTDATRTRLTRVFSGRLARGIVNELLLSLAPHDADVPAYPVQNWLAQPFRRAAAAAGQKEWLALWAGQSAALAKRQPASAVFARLVAEAEHVHAALASARA